MNDKAFTIFLVDDDAGVLTALSRLLRAKGYNVQPFTSPNEFLSKRDATLPGCVILDVTMPGLDGLNLQQALSSEDVAAPGDLPDRHRRYSDQRAGDACGCARFPHQAGEHRRPVSGDRACRGAECPEPAKRAPNWQAIQAKMATLTRRESEVLVHVVAGRLNKQIAHDLGTVEKTIKVHRGRMMQKLGVHTVADLVRLAERVGIRARDVGHQT